MIITIYQQNAHCEVCDIKNQNSLEVKTGNMTSLSKVVSVVFKDRKYNTLTYLIQVAGNAFAIDDKYTITQQELQEILRYIELDKVTYADLLEIQNQLPEKTSFIKLTAAQQLDAKNVLDDIINVATQMENAKNVSNLSCKFVLLDNPIDAFSDEKRASLGDTVENRMVSAKCRHKK